MELRTKEVVSTINQTGSTWVPVSENDKIGSDLVVRRHNGKKYATHPWYQRSEKNCARMIVRYLKEYAVDEKAVERIIAEFEASEGIKLADEQREGVYMMCRHRFCILTGGPGTGKTSVLKCGAKVLKTLYPDYFLAFSAPTGKASRRITEGTGYPATTIQKKIHDTGKSDYLLPIADNVMFLDEISMLDLETFEKFLMCVSNHTRVILVGDVDQLPSVGAGAVLRDLIDSNVLPVTQLEKTFRQDNSSVLFENIQVVKKGGYVPLFEGSDFKRIKSERNVFETCVSEYLKALKEYGMENTVILTPYRKAGTVCSEKLNNVLQEKVNPNGYGFTKTVNRDGRKLRITFKEGDPVIHLRNRDGIANGDVGVITEITEKAVIVNYSDTLFKYRTGGSDLDDLDLAYALSVNKSQGSEYKCVITPLLRENKNLDRNMVYTAITRAKKMCVVIGEDRIIQDACKIQSSWERDTFLCEELQVKSKVVDLMTTILAM